MVKRPKTVKVIELEEHVSPGGNTKFTTKSGASDAAKRKALGRARQKQGQVAPREKAKRAREEWDEDKKTVSPGGQTVYSRPVTPSPLKKGNPMQLDGEFYARERQLLQKRQSKRLLDTRMKNSAAAVAGRLRPSPARRHRAAR